MLHTYVYVTTIKEKNVDFKSGKSMFYGKIWRKEREGKIM